jgi:hypothetical protein
LFVAAEGFFVAADLAVGQAIVFRGLPSSSHQQFLHFVRQ